VSSGDLEPPPNFPNNPRSPAVERGASAALLPGGQSTMTAERIPLAFPTDHPALPGHFPGNPIVPGAVLLSEVATALLARKNGGHISGFPSVKFLSPLRPDQAADIVFTDKGPGHVSFEVVSGDRRIVSGSLRYTAP
jgi:3-hydroxyacyl-[acyl-carrier-protein] dehydratase